jgi:chemotaxis regulatin CheY-phosphate phosphatase CheZ
MSMQRVKELLYDSEATLRLLDNQLDELRDPEPSVIATAQQSEREMSALGSLPAILERANFEIQSVLGSLRASRTALEAATMDKIAVTHEKLREVTSATEVAATDILDSCDRAQGMIDELDSLDAEGIEGRAGELRGHLRDEIFQMMGSLQFQDITTQQLAYASSVLTEMENRLIDIAKLFDSRTIDQAVQAIAPNTTFDPNATTRDAETRQALADQIFMV